jgi:hypothetical protein
MKSKWISLEDKDPPLNELVLIRCGKYVDAGWRTGSVRYPFAFVERCTLDSYDADNDTVHANAWCQGKVTHWMPLPDAPVEE